MHLYIEERYFTADIYASFIVLQINFIVYDYLKYVHEFSGKMAIA